MSIVIKRNRCRKGGGVEWGGARTPEGSGVKGGKTLLWMKRTRWEMQGEAETHFPPREEKAEVVRKAEDNRRGRNCPDGRNKPGLLHFCWDSPPTWSFQMERPLPYTTARLCTLLEQGHSGGSGSPLREAYSISTFLQCNSPPSELPIDNNQLPVMFLSTYCVSGTVLSTSHTLSHLILIITFSYSHILENETEAQRGYMTCPRSPS